MRRLPGGVIRASPHLCVRVRECVLRLLPVSHCAVDTGSDKDQKSVRWQLVVVPQEGSRLPPPPRLITGDCLDCLVQENICQIMLQIRELLWGLLLIGCAGKKRSLSSVVFDAGSSAGVELRDTEADHAAPGAASSGRRHPCARFRTARPCRSFIPVQTNFSGDPGLFMRQIPICALPPVQVSNRRIWFVFPGTGSRSRRTFASFLSILRTLPVGGCRWRWRRDSPTHSHPLLPSPN